MQKKLTPKQSDEIINDMSAGFSETMIIEFADTRDGFGVRKIEKWLKDVYKVRDYNVLRIRAKILLDMAENEW